MYRPITLSDGCETLGVHHKWLTVEFFDLWDRQCGDFFQGRVRHNVGGEKDVPSQSLVVVGMGVPKLVVLGGASESWCSTKKTPKNGRCLENFGLRRRVGPPKKPNFGC